MNSTPARPMLARQSDEGVSVNESAVCAGCLNDAEVLSASRDNWADAEDVTHPESQDDTLHPADNPDARCNGCGAATLETEPTA